MKPIFTLFAALALAGCLNPTEGDFGIVEVVPEQETCYDTTLILEPGRGHRMGVRPRACYGEGYDVAIFGRRW
jgi:hypothetical protein